MAVASGALIGESLRVGTSLEGVRLTIHRIARADCGDISAGQPLTWTFLEFHVQLDDVDSWSEKLSEVLDDRFGWYCDFRSPTETFVVFARQIFRYPRGDEDGRARAAAHARSVGVPDAQIDWPE